MTRRLTIVAAPLTCLLAAGACVENFEPLATRIDYHYLVVDGYLNNGPDSTIIRLTHTQTLNGENQITPETSATVIVEEEDGSTFQLSNAGGGKYFIAHVPVNAAKRYRLKITANALDYESDFVAPIVTPPIDSVSWKVTNQGPIRGIRIFANTHDLKTNSIFYLWNYDESWEYSSKYTSYFVNNGDTIIPRRDNIYYCYKGTSSSQIYVGTSAPLSENIISEFPLVFIPLTSNMLSRRFSIRLKQLSLSRGAYDYWLSIQKNTEELGSIFGPLPYQGSGNIRCVTNSSQGAVGYFVATSLQEKRIFITSDQVPTPHDYDNGYESCQFHFVPLSKVKEATTDLVVDGIWDLNVLQGYIESPPFCVDCRLQGGTTTPPTYW